MSTPLFAVRLNAGAFISGVQTASASDVMRLRLLSTSGVKSARWEIRGYPPGWSVPSGWTQDPDPLRRVIYATGLTPDDVTLPSSLWGKWLLSVIVNDTQVDRGTSAIEILGPNGLHALPAGETTEWGGAAEQWAKHLDADIRILATTGGGGGGTLAGDVTGPSGGNTVVKLQGRAVSSQSPNPGQLLGWDGSVWKPTTNLPPTDAQVQAAISGTQSVALAGGATTLTSAQCAGGSIVFTGTLSADAVYTFPTVASMPGIAGRSYWLTAPAFGAQTLRFNGGAGGSTFLLPGQSRRITIDSAGVLRCEGAYAWECVLEIDLANTNAVPIGKLPPGATLEVCEALVTQTITLNSVGGVIGWGVSTNEFGGSAYDILKIANGSMSTSGVRRGRNSSDWGAPLFAQGRWDDAGGAVLWWVRDTNTSQYATGKILVIAGGRWLA